MMQLPRTSSRHHINLLLVRVDVVGDGDSRPRLRPLEVVGDGVLQQHLLNTLASASTPIFMTVTTSSRASSHRGTVSMVFISSLTAMVIFVPFSSVRLLESLPMKLNTIPVVSATLRLKFCVWVATYSGLLLVNVLNITSLHNCQSVLTSSILNIIRNLGGAISMSPFNALISDTIALHLSSVLLSGLSFMYA